MSFDLELFVHPMCPFAQRCLHVARFKQLSLKIQFVNLSDKPAWFLDINPSGSLPVLLVNTGCSRVLLHESLVISQYLDALPGESLYPKGPCSIINALEKAKIDMLISTEIEPLRRAIRMAYWNKEPNKRHVASFQRIVKDVDAMVPKGEYFVVAGCRNKISFLDLMAFPLIERIIAFKDLGLPYYVNLDISNLVAYYERISGLEFVQQTAMPLVRYVNLRKRMQNKQYKGLELPAEVYDGAPMV